MVLLALEQHLTAAAMAQLVREVEPTVRRWLKRWVAQGLEGRKDRPMPGPAPKITKESEEQWLAWVRLRPGSLGQSSWMWTLQRRADSLAEQSGRRASYQTVGLILKAGEIVLSRPEHTLRSPEPQYKGKKRRWKRQATA
jgi:transposase